MSEQLTLQVEDQRTARRAIKRLEVEEDEILDANKADLGDAIIRLAADNPDLLVRKLQQVQNQREKYWSDKDYQQARGESDE
ncbi:hypothetical protein [Natronolimnobius baerhuensis]|uniref:Uncharacterized protein n=1 Tax=Natronolimnobius baerhuensis TaxID=253108 RepID=A0A202EAV1_9EURY|nr:hypothetical protein [Natronolimnobius baerhuensis]OVE85090.1 hypothetical protein B2G88_12145 [Natronolimnobius baerhuensis]